MQIARRAKACTTACCSPRPTASCSTYDKRHLFRYAKEHERYAAGRDRLTVEWKGWRICPLVCYDLRFPVFSRNRFDVERPGGWTTTCCCTSPTGRRRARYAWKTLLRARAIENLCFVAGLNRVGTDGNGLHYSGDSAVIDFLGHPLSECTDEEVVVTTTLPAAELVAHRERFPAMLDGDAFALHSRSDSSAAASVAGLRNHATQCRRALDAACGSSLLRSPRHGGD